MALVKHIFKHTSRAMCGQKFVTVGHRQIFAKKGKKDLTGLDSFFSIFYQTGNCECQLKKDGLASMIQSIAEEETCKLGLRSPRI
jgi:hypothetical protein